MAVISWFRQRFVINTMYSLEHQSLEMVAMTTFEICCSEKSGVTSADQAKSSYGTNCFDSGPKIWNRKILQRNRQLQRCTAASFDCQRSVNCLAATASSKCVGNSAITGALVSVNERQSSKKKLPLKFELPRGSWTEAERALKTIWSILSPCLELCRVLDGTSASVLEQRVEAWSIDRFKQAVVIQGQW